MTQARDIISEIIEVRSRRASDYGMSELIVRLRTLESTFEKRDCLDTELLKYFPVAVVACLEGYFRLAIKQLIDAGEPYLSNAGQLIKKLTFDYEAVKALHGKYVSIGEFIAHNLSLSQLAHINNHMSAILGKDFLKELRSVTNRLDHKIHGKPKTPILVEPDSIYRDVSRTFELRHIVCHELASNFEVKPMDIEQGFLACTLFLKASEELMGETLYPNALLTQTDMNNAANADLMAALAKVVELNKNLRDKLPPDRIEAFNLTDDLWKDFMEAWAKFDAHINEGSTIWPTIYCWAAQNIVEHRIQQLTTYIKHI